MKPTATNGATSTRTATLSEVPDAVKAAIRPHANMNAYAIAIHRNQ